MVTPISSVKVRNPYQMLFSFFCQNHKSLCCHTFSPQLCNMGDCLIFLSTTIEYLFYQSCLLSNPFQAHVPFKLTTDRLIYLLNWTSYWWLCLFKQFYKFSPLHDPAMIWYAKCLTCNVSRVIRILKYSVISKHIGYEKMEQ